ncbi:septum formation family protein [Amycolatopsis anabasis]|uniref:septum formation family protein n=1 Tax=Amycolatopsis anabasis TaxID=1840409 RepID=UPI00131E8432|nr:septum formation family protein [Amycolatopsis anabasis]
MRESAPTRRTVADRVRKFWFALRRGTTRATTASKAAILAVGPRRWRVIGVITATALTAGVLSLTWQPDDTWAGTVPSASQVAGTCHVIEIDAERHSFSDVRPPVPCDQPHQTETAAVGELPSELRDKAHRMTPERRLMVLEKLCKEPVRNYVGAGPRDELWMVTVLLRLPTEREWDEGARQYRCELALTDVKNPEVLRSLTESLRGILKQSAGAKFRRCWTDLVTEVTCDQPHRSESVNSIAAVPADRIAGPPAGFSAVQRDAFHAWADPICQQTVSEFLGRPVHETPYRPEAHLSKDGRVIECSVAFPAAQPMTSGSVERVRKEHN